MLRRALAGLLSAARGEFEVGTHVGSLFIWDPERREFRFYEAKVKWEEERRGRWRGRAVVEVPEGAVLKYVRYVKKGQPPVTEYYVARGGELVQADYETVRRVLKEVDGVRLEARCNVVRGTDAEDCLYYVSGLGTRFGGGAASYFQPTWSREEAERYAARLEPLGEALKEIKRRVRELVGVEPTRLVNVEFPLEAGPYSRPGRVCLALPFLGPRFREVAGRFRYDDVDGCFWFGEDVLGREVFEKLKKALLKTAG